MDEFNKERGYTYDRKTDQKRHLTDQEKSELIKQRQVFIENGRAFVEQNNLKFRSALMGQVEQGFVDITFDSEDEYVRFTDWVFTRYGGPAGLVFGRAGVEMNIQLEFRLLRQTITEFKFRPILLEDYEKAASRRVTPYAFDRANIEGRKVPGSKWTKK